MEELRTYHPIHLDSLVIDTILGFDLYAKMPKDRFVLICGRRFGFTSSHRDNLIANGTHTLFVADDDQSNYGEYIEQNLGQVVSDPQVPSQKKAELLYSVSKGVLLDAFSNPRSADMVRRTEEVMPHMVDVILQGKESLQNLISIMSHDYYTFTHSINVCVFSVALANFVGLKDRAKLHDLAVGALLHDIGKSEVPKAILNKTGLLTTEEMEVMKSHVIRGEKILGDKNHMNSARMLPVSLHHERLNGKGYPRHLLTDQIHIHGKIAAIADCFDAMTTNRPYKQAMKAFEAVQLMKGKFQDSYDQSLLGYLILLLKKVQ